MNIVLTFVSHTRKRNVDHCKAYQQQHQHLYNVRHSHEPRQEALGYFIPILSNEIE